MRDSCMIYRNQADALRELPAEQFKAAVLALWDYELDGIVPEGDPITIAMFRMAQPLIDKRNRNYENGLKGGRPAKKTKEQAEEEKQARRTTEYYKWRDAVYERDNYTCQECGSTENLHAHHIKTMAEAPELMYELSNGITLCRSCHMKVHNQKNRNDDFDNRNGELENRNYERDNRIDDFDNAKDKGKRIKDKDIKDISVKPSGFKPPTQQEVSDYIAEKGYKVDAGRFVDFYEAKGWMIGKNKMKDWKAAVRTWARSPKQETKPAAPVNRFNNFQQRTYDFDDLEKRLLGRA